MLRHHLLFLGLSATSLLGLALLLGGCEQRTTLGVAPVEDCDLDVENLDGMFVAKKATPDKGEFEDKDFRIKFYQENGKKMARSTGGRIFPQLPLTQKFVYEFVEVKETATGDKEAFYRADLAKFYGFNEKELEEHKQKNKDLGWKVEGMLYIRVDDKQCALKVSDMYATYIEGKRVEDFNVGGQSKYVRSEEDRYSMIDCPQAYRRDHPEDNRQGELVPWDKATPDPNKDESYPRDRAGTIVPTGKPVYWSFIETERNTKTEAKSEEQCSYYLDVYVDDLPVADKQNIPVEVGDKWTYWTFEMTHTPLEDPTFIEIHRHKVCGGKDEIIDAVCNIVKTETPAEEGGA